MTNKVKPRKRSHKTQILSRTIPMNEFKPKIKALLKHDAIRIEMVVSLGKDPVELLTTRLIAMKEVPKEGIKK